MYKIGLLTNNETIEHIYSNEYALQKTSGPDRLVISSEKNQIKLAMDLISNTSNQFGILYLLLVSRIGNKPGRYQIEVPLNRSELNTFCEKYTLYFESDGRHHVWLASLNSSNMIVYDNHNVLYAYGAIGEYENILKAKKYRKVNEITFPSQHTHDYNYENDNYENDLISNNSWIYSNLMENDDY